MSVCLFVCLCVCYRKEALLNYTNAVDLTKVYEDKFQQLYETLKQVDQESEYVEFIRDNKQ